MEKKKSLSAPFEGNSYFCTQWTETGTGLEKWTFASSFKWVTLSGVLVYVVLSGAREKDVEGTNASCLNVKAFVVPWQTRSILSLIVKRCRSQTVGPSPPVDYPLVTGCGLYQLEVLPVNINYAANNRCKEPYWHAFGLFLFWSPFGFCFYACRCPSLDDFCRWLALVNNNKYICILFITKQGCKPQICLQVFYFREWISLLTSLHFKF